MASVRSITARRNGPTQVQYQQVPTQQPQPQTRVRTAQFGGIQQQQQQQITPQPQDGGVITYKDAINHLSYRFTKLEQRVIILERTGVSSSSDSANSALSSGIDETAINDILERIDAIEDWINANNFGQQLQQIQQEFNKQTKLQNDRILKLENELKKKTVAPRIPLQQPPQQPQQSFIQENPINQKQQQSFIQESPINQYQQQQSLPQPRRFGGNRNQPRTTIMELPIDNNGNEEIESNINDEDTSNQID